MEQTSSLTTLLPMSRHWRKLLERDQAPLALRPEEVLSQFWVTRLQNECSLRSGWFALEDPPESSVSCRSTWAAPGRNPGRARKRMLQDHLPHRPAAPQQIKQLLRAARECEPEHPPRARE